MNIKINIPQNNNLAEFKAKLIIERIKQKNISIQKQKILLKEVIKSLESYGKQKML